LVVGVGANGAGVRVGSSRFERDTTPPDRETAGRAP
jgi:hypothetical protein